MRRQRVFTWHVHGSYLWYLTHAAQDFYVPVKPGRPEGYGGRAGSLPWPENLHEVPAEDVRHLELDCVLFQSRNNYLLDQYEILSDEQQRLPRIYLEHDPPRQHPTDTQHVVDDPNMLLVHVTQFNALMWDSGRTPTRVVEHGVTVDPNAHYTGEIERGAVVVNGLSKRGRRLGADLFDRVRRDVPLDIAGMGSEELGGEGDLSREALAQFVTKRRFFFNPIRYTSLGLAVCEAMMLGVPVIGLATTEMATVIENGVSGYIDTDARRLIAVMQDLLHDPAEARRLGEGARRTAERRFDIGRFAADWDAVFAQVTGTPRTAEALTSYGSGATA
jgi:glycosyltransferase involved in cell wall biosynthesis